MTRFVFVLISSALFFSAPTASFADDSRARQVEQLSRDATTKYRDADYLGAIKLFEEAYAIEPVPNLLFNIARCHEKLEDWDSAISNYQKFVVEPDVERSARQAALDRIDALNEVKLAEVQTKNAQEEQVVVRPADPPPKVSGPDRTWSYVTLGTGVGLLAGGALFGVLASSKQTEFEEGVSVEEKKDARSSGQTFALVADGLYISGAIVSVIGVYLLLASGSEETATAGRVTPLGWVEAGGGGLGLHTRF